MAQARARPFAGYAVLALAVLSWACGPASAQGRLPFAEALASYCGQAFEGRVVSADPVDDDWRRARLVVHIRDCGPDGFSLPLSLDEDRSRTWVLTQAGPDEGWELRHVHLHEDGAADKLSLYGGLSRSGSGDWRQEFPADAFSRELFASEGIPASAQNVWAVEVDSVARLLAYELRRPGRFFRVEMDLSRPVPLPPAHWGVSATDGP